MSKSIRHAYSALLRHESWNVGLVREPIHIFLKPGIKPTIHWLPKLDRTKFLADPFGTVRENRLHILCEEYDYNRLRGRIIHLDVDYRNGLTIRQRHVVFGNSYHFSYPFLIEYAGEIFCIPETHQAAQISLYRATVFPTQWERVANLVRNYPALDPTIFFYEGTWWLTCTYYNDRPLQKLYAWYAKDLLGPWRPHEHNPIKTDPSSTRPAGTPFYYNGILYRPAQDNSRTYGGGIIINRIVTLTPTEFEEVPVSHVLPYRESDWPAGVHTLSAVGGFTLIDAKRFTFIKEAFKHSLRKNIKEVVTKHAFGPQESEGAGIVVGRPHSRAACRRTERTWKKPS